MFFFLNASGTLRHSLPALSVLSDHVSVTCDFKIHYLLIIEQGTIERHERLKKMVSVYNPHRCSPLLQ